MRPWQVIILVIILAFFAVSSGWKVLYILAYVLVALLVFSWLWSRLSLRKLEFQRTASSGRVQVGETFDERLILDNLSTLPKLWVQVSDGSDLPGHRAGYVASMGGRKRALWRARCRCLLRGRFTLGPVVVTSGDPFGLFSQQKTLAGTQDLLVLPRVYDLSHFILFTGGLPGRGNSSRRALQATTNAMTIREYVSGDALSRIHWRSSAHFNKLMVKEFDLDPAVDVWLFLDLHEGVQSGEGVHSTEEYGVTIAASIAIHLLQQGLAVGLVTNGEKRELLNLDRGDRQVERVLELLAVVTAGPGPDLKEALSMDGFHFGRNAVAIVITPSNSQDWHGSLRHLQMRGVQVAVVGLHAATFNGQPADEDALALLEGAGVPIIRVNKGDAIAQALESGSDAYAVKRR